MTLAAPTTDQPAVPGSTGPAPRTGEQPTDLMTTPAADAPAERFAARVLAAALGHQEITAIHLGDRLGWYRALREQGLLTSSELALATGTVERYTREWLEHQAAAGYLELVRADGRAHRYRLHPGAAEVLTDEDSLAYTAPAARLLAGAGRLVDRLVEVYRTGGGISWAELGRDVREAQADFNRPMFLHGLTQELLPQAPELHARLRSGGRVADIGCGEGWSSVGLALGYPDVMVDGFDLDPPSIAAARRHAAGAGVSDRMRFVVGDAAVTAAAEGHRYDVVLAVECLHDMPDPVGVLTAMRSVVAEDGWVVVVDERTSEDLTAPAEPFERLLYGFSLVCCLPDGLSHPGGAGTGTVMRPHVLGAYAREAGFRDVEVLPIEHEAFRFYRLVR